MKTVTVGGMIYELNELYLMHNGSESGQQLHELCEISESGNFIDENGSHWGFARNNIKLGTITPVPAELVDGKAYQFDFDGEVYHGIYVDAYKCFSCLNRNYHIDLCTNIIPLIPGVK